MKRFVILALVSACLLAALSVGPAFAAEKTTITFWHAMGAQLGKTLDSLVAEFNQQSPDVLVKAEYQGNYGALSQKIVGSLVARKPPTLAQVYGNWAAEYISSEELVPVEKFIKGPNGMSQLEVDDIWDGLRAGSTFDGVWYTMPFNKSVYVLVYNKTAFKEAGIANPPSSWQELLTAAKALTVKDGDKVVRYGLGLRPNVDIYACFFFTAGGAWLDGQNKVNVNSQAGVKALQFMADLVNKHKVAYYVPGYIDADFGAGKAAMYLTTSPGLSYTEQSVAGKFDWSAAPVPFMDAKYKATPVAGTDLAIFARASQREQEAAWEFIKWMVEPKQTAKWSIGTSYVPVRKSAQYLDMMKQWFASHPRNEQSLKQLRYIKYDPNIAAWSNIRNDISEAVEKVFLGKATAQEALDAAVLKGNARMK
ncbi:MAG: ABC transporter substrate-binding protein [Clostridia bacterium]|nr:ABC transporter substrate-binding protein [Clostridia bacterium]